MLPLCSGAAAGAPSSGISTSPPVRAVRPSGASSLGVGALRMASRSSRPASPVQVPGSVDMRGGGVKTLHSNSLALLMPCTLIAAGLL